MPVISYYHQNTFISVMHGSVQTGPGAHPASCNGHRVIAGDKAATHPYLLPRLKKQQSCTFTAPLGLRGSLLKGKGPICQVES